MGGTSEGTGHALPHPSHADLTDLDLFADGFPHEVFERLRGEGPVSWHEPTAHTPGGEGFWSVVTYDETLEVLDHPETYSSERGGDREHGGTLLIDLPVAGVVLNMMDDPRHARIRRLVSKGLTPQTVQRLEDDLRARTRRLLEELDPLHPNRSVSAGGSTRAASRDRTDDGAEFDFLVEVAAELPMQAICFLLGVPEADRHQLFECVEHVFDFRDEQDYFAFTPQQTDSLTWMLGYGSELIAEKRRQPTDDMLSAVVGAELPDVEPSGLTDGELDAFFSLLFSAGSETTRNAVAGGLLALIAHPEQLAALRDDRSLMPTAVEEILRWTSPSPSKRRTATRDVELAGCPVAPGDKVVVWEASANRDERRFPDGMRFDIRRDPNPHLAFGHGIHYCLGAHLARLELRVLLEELLDTFVSFEVVGPVEWTRSNRHTGVRHLPVRVRRR